MNVANLGAVRAASGRSLVVFFAFSALWAAAGTLLVAYLPTAGTTVWAQDALLGLGTLARLAGIGLLVLWLGKLRLTDVGLHPARLPAGVLLTALVWIAAQGMTLATSGLGTNVEQHPDWADPAAVLGRLARQMLAVSLVEETAYRGYLLPQVFIALAGRWPGDGRWQWPAALAISQGLFALAHVPFLSYAGLSPAEALSAMPVILVFGVLFSALYLMTGNLFLAVGVHALVTAPTPLFATPGLGAGLPITEAALLVLAVAALWWELRGGPHPNLLPLR